MAYLLELPGERFVAQAREFFAQREKLISSELSRTEPPLEAPAQEARRREAAQCAAALQTASAVPQYFCEVLRLSQPKIKGMEELPAYTGYFFSDDYPVDVKVKDKVMGKGDPQARVRELLAALPAMDFSSDTAIEESIKALAAQGGLGFGDYQAVARLALSGTNVGPSITGMFRVLGQERVRARLARLVAGA
jgi:nondiscriminating glutamyl-tRNA synthetase